MVSNCHVFASWLVVRCFRLGSLLFVICGWLSALVSHLFVVVIRYTLLVVGGSLFVVGWWLVVGSLLLVVGSWLLGVVFGSWVLLGVACLLFMC